MARARRSSHALGETRRLTEDLLAAATMRCRVEADHRALTSRAQEAALLSRLSQDCAANNPEHFTSRHGAGRRPSRVDRRTNTDGRVRRVPRVQRPRGGVSAGMHAAGRRSGRRVSLLCTSPTSSAATPSVARNATGPTARRARNVVQSLARADLAAIACSRWFVRPTAATLEVGIGGGRGDAATPNRSPETIAPSVDDGLQVPDGRGWRSGRHDGPRFQKVRRVANG